MWMAISTKSLTRIGVATPWHWNQGRLCHIRCFTRRPAAATSDAGDVEPSHRALDGCFNILSQAAIAVEPSNGALHHPTARQENEALGCVGALDDLDGPVAEALRAPPSACRRHSLHRQRSRRTRKPTS